MQEMLFISHSTPEDSEFCIWLASRLEMLGYKVWIDLKNLYGGERSWQKIQQAIKESAKVLLVYSKYIIDDGEIKQSIDDELRYARSFAESRKLKDFIIPLHLDESPYDLVIGLPNINHIQFNESWTSGLSHLKKKLDKDDVQHDEDVSSSLVSWYENSYSTDCQIINKKELYYSSWWGVKDCPGIFCLYHFANSEQAKAVRNSNREIPIALSSNVLSTFEEKISYEVEREGETFDVLPIAVYAYSLDDVLYGFDSEDFPTHKEVENYFKDYIRFLIHCILERKGCCKTPISNKRLAFYRERGKTRFRDEEIYYKFSSQQKPRHKRLGGKYLDKGSWHYAISVKPLLFPVIGVSIQSHLLFTSDGHVIISNDSKQHAYRRNKGKTFYNSEWRDLLLAMLSSLKDSESEIKIQVTYKGDFLKMNLWPETFWSDYGYNDPSSKMSESDLETVSYIEEEEIC